MRLMLMITQKKKLQKYQRKSKKKFKKQEKATDNLLLPIQWFVKLL